MLRTFACLVKASGLSTESSGKPVHDRVTSGYASVMAANITNGSNNNKLSALVTWIHLLAHLVILFSLWKNSLLRN